jgi:hypothetical protein
MPNKLFSSPRQIPANILIGTHVSPSVIISYFFIAPKASIAVEVPQRIDHQIWAGRERARRRCDGSRPLVRASRRCGFSLNRSANPSRNCKATCSTKFVIKGNYEHQS